jgi:protein-S-isoprenylcysteine O-methyltransferase Ste14
MVKIVSINLLLVVTILIPLTVPSSTLNILYSVVSVLFSVGMSLVIAFNGSRIVNAKFKKSIRAEIHMVRNRFLGVFVISTIFYLLYSVCGKLTFVNNIRSSLPIALHFSVYTSSVLCYSILLFICNYVKINELYEQIEDWIKREDSFPN